ncbi:MAG TPA: MopE-related protein [Myxococcota bacterium]|nr:MopE-related protein [Myxococcota bacterium]
MFLLLSALSCRNKELPVDTGDPCETFTSYADSDGDGFGDGDNPTEACELPSGNVEDSTDCDDADAAVHPGATEDDCADPVDYNCDGSVGYADADSDGYAACEECDDDDPDINPGAAEICDGIDQDCDGEIDDGVLETFWADADSDGYGDPDAGTEACESPDGYADNGDDCDDTDATSWPGAEEICDEADNDCDGDVDEDVTMTYWADLDEDGYGDSDVPTEACDLPTGFAEVDGDCDDGEATVYPGAEEVVADGIDQDCDSGDTCYTDGDGDDYGSGTTTSTDLDCADTGEAEVEDDCDDGDSAVNPDADEVCNEIDDDCDGDIDEDDAIDADTWYADTDSDDYGDAASSTTACSEPSGYVSDATDCDDTDSDTYPGADEYCDGHDDDCDGDIDEDDAVDASTFYEDADGDSYGNLASTATACSAPSGYVSDDTDCDDTDKTINPAASESCNGDDDDCDGDVDEGVLGTGTDCPADSCATILADGSTADGTYVLEDSSGSTYDVHCDMTTDSGGWTLVGSVVNEAHVTGSHDRNWDSYDVWTDDTTFGTLGSQTTADFKSTAFSEVAGDDMMVETDSYAFAFYNVLGSTDFGDFMTGEYDSSTCSEDFIASGADWSSGLTTDQEDVLVLVVRPKDSNCSCFPGCNENAILGFQLSSCCWANGLGNTPNGYASWDIYDNSLLTTSYISKGTCTAGSYPCSDAGYYNASGTGYTYSNKVTYGLVYVR